MTDARMNLSVMTAQHYNITPLHSSRRHVGCDDCLENKRVSEMFSAVQCTTIVHSYKHNT